MTATVPAVDSRRSNWMGITSVLIGFFGAMIGPLGYIAGIVFGHLSIRATQRGEADNEVLGRVGAAMNYIALAVSVVVTVFIVLIYVGMIAGFVAWCEANPELCESESTYSLEMT